MEIRTSVPDICLNAVFIEYTRRMRKNSSDDFNNFNFNKCFKAFAMFFLETFR